MYVCLCQGVTDHAIRDEVRTGACSMRDLQQRLGVAQCCGRCAPCAREVLTESLRDARRDAYPPVEPPAFATVNTT